MSYRDILNNAVATVWENHILLVILFMFEIAGIVLNILELIEMDPVTSE